MLNFLLKLLFFFLLRLIYIDIVFSIINIHSLCIILDNFGKANLRGRFMEKNLLGQYLRKLRKAHGYTQEYVASQLNIIHQTYSHYETGRIIPPSDSLVNLARLYSVPLVSLMELTVNYHINPDFLRHYSDAPMVSQELTDFLEYIDLPENVKKFKNLNQKEKRILYYFQFLSFQGQEEAIDIMEVKYHHELRKKKER